MKDVYKILCINPGSTSTKLAIFENEKMLNEVNIEHRSEDLAQYKDIIGQLPLRKAAIDAYLAEQGLNPATAITRAPMPSTRI